MLLTLNLYRLGNNWKIVKMGFESSLMALMCGVFKRPLLHGQTWVALIVLPYLLCENVVSPALAVAQRHCIHGLSLSLPSPLSPSNSLFTFSLLYLLLLSSRVVNSRCVPGEFSLFVLWGNANSATSAAQRKCFLYAAFQFPCVSMNDDVNIMYGHKCSFPY